MYRIPLLRIIIVFAWVTPSKTRRISLFFLLFVFFFIHIYPAGENSLQSGSKPSDLVADSMLAHTQFCQLSLVFTSLPFTQHGNGQLTFCPCALLWLRILCSLPSLLFLRTDVDCPEPRIAFPGGPFALLQSFISYGRSFKTTHL